MLLHRWIKQMLLIMKRITFREESGDSPSPCHIVTSWGIGYGMQNMEFSGKSLKMTSDLSLCIKGCLYAAALSVSVSTLEGSEDSEGNCLFP